MYLRNKKNETIKNWRTIFMFLNYFLFIMWTLRFSIHAKVNLIDLQ